MGKEGGEKGGWEEEKIKKRGQMKEERNVRKAEKRGEKRITEMEGEKNGKKARECEVKRREHRI